MKPPRAPLGGAHRRLAESTTVVVAAGLVCALIAVVVGCESKDVDLGGTDMAEASSSLSYDTDAAALAEICEPCTQRGDCNEPGIITCGALLASMGDNNTYCGTLCPSHSECEDDEDCEKVSSPDDGDVFACVPKSGTCGTAPPLVIDGTTLEQCGPLSGPTVMAYCTGCLTDGPYCQLNGCYAGLWCDTRNGQCYDPPSTCP